MVSELGNTTHAQDGSICCKGLLLVNYDVKLPLYITIWCTALQYKRLYLGILQIPLIAASGTTLIAR